MADSTQHHPNQSGPGPAAGSQHPGGGHPIGGRYYQPPWAGQGHGGGPGHSLSHKEQSAYDLLAQTLRDWGLGALVKYARQFIQQGMSQEEIQLHLEQTPEYQHRFAGNELRKQNGLGTLSPAQYIALEDQYRQVLSQYGMPKGFYDQHKDFANWIGGDVSPSEVQARADIAKQQYLNAPAEMRAYWQQNFGLTAGDAVASILDPNHESLADLQRQANAVAIGGSALQQGIDVGRKRALQLADNGVTLQQARQAYSRIAQFGATDQSIAQRFGTQFGQRAEENSLLLGDAAANQQRDLIYGEEAAQFAGRGGASVQTSSVSANY